MMVNSDKKTLRCEYKKIREAISDKCVLSQNITASLSDTILYKNADIILAYWSVGSEVDTHRIIENAIRSGRKVALPRCADRNGNMRFYYISEMSDLNEGMYGIMEPTGSALADSFTEKSICLVPALSFDKSGCRLGYGKGYYDRFLSSFCGNSIGLCFEDCLTDSLPTDEFDRKVNYIISEKKIYKIR